MYLVLTFIKKLIQKVMNVLKNLNFLNEMETIHMY